MVSKFRTRTRDPFRRASIIQDAFKPLWEESARSAAIVAAGLLDDQLGMAIEHHLISLDEADIGSLFHGFGPFASLSGRILVAFAMGIVGRETRKDLEKIGQIRNEFAHNPEQVDFESSDVAKLCTALTFPTRRRAHSEKLAQTLKEAGSGGELLDTWPRHNRALFLMTTFFFCEALFLSLVVASQAKNARPQIALRD